jgi:hypothetical protein
MKIGILKSSVNTGLDTEIKFELVTPLNIVSNQPAFASEMMSLRRNIISMNTQRWEVTANVMPSNDDSSANFLVHAVTYGYNRKVYLRVPQIYRGSAPTPAYTDITLTSPVVRGASVLPLTGNNSKKIKDGEFINVTGHDKVYLVTEVTADGSAITIEPPLRKDTLNGVKIAYGSRTTMVCKYGMDSVLGIKYTDGILADPGAFTFIEDI